MQIILDNHPMTIPSYLTSASTLGDLLSWVKISLPEHRIIIKVTLDGTVLEGADITQSRARVIGDGTLILASTDRRELSITMLGKLAALIEWLSPQHTDIAAMFERGETPRALERLGQIISAWQQIQGAYGNLAKILGLALKELPVHQLNGEEILNEFCRQLGEIQTALQNNDFVILSDILQYEMDGVVANWMALLESTLGVVDPVGV